MSEFSMPKWLDDFYADRRGSGRFYQRSVPKPIEPCDHDWRIFAILDNTARVICADCRELDVTAAWSMDHLKSYPKWKGVAS